MKTTTTNALHVINLTIDGRPAYLAEPGQWDGSWYTRDAGRAKTYRLRRNAEKRIAEHGSVWAEFSPRVDIYCVQPTSNV